MERALDGKLCLQASVAIKDATKPPIALLRAV
jgi:hypothetical protein